MTSCLAGTYILPFQSSCVNKADCEPSLAGQMTGVDAVPSSSNFAAGRGGCAPDSAAARAQRWMPRASTCCIPDRRLPAPWARGMPARFAACRTAARRTQQRSSAFPDRQIPSPAIPSAGQAALTALLRPEPDASCPPDGVVRSPCSVVRRSQPRDQADLSVVEKTDR